MLSYMSLNMNKGHKPAIFSITELKKKKKKMNIAQLFSVSRI